MQSIIVKERYVSLWGKNSENSDSSERGRETKIMTSGEHIIFFKQVKIS